MTTKQNINYKELYKKIIGRYPRNNEQLTKFIEFVTEMSNNNDSNPLHYDMETLYEYADAFDKKVKLKRIFD